MKTRLLAPIVAFLVLASIPLWNLPSYPMAVIIVTFIYIALASSWNIIGGYAGYLSFGHVAFFGIGAYVTGLLLLNYGISPFLTTPLAGVVAAVFAVIVGYPCLRIRGPYFALVTLVLALAVQVLVVNVPYTKGTIGFWLPQLPFDMSLSYAIYFEAFLVLMSIAVGIAWWIERSKLGAGLAAMREDEDVAQTVGVNATVLKLQAFAISAFLTGMIGGMYSYYRTYVVPGIMFDTNISVAIVLMAMFGGTQTWKGPVVGAAVLTVISEMLAVSIGSEKAHIMYGLLLVLVIMFMPDGVMAFFTDGRLARLFGRGKPEPERA